MKASLPQFLFLAIFGTLSLWRGVEATEKPSISGDLTKLTISQLEQQLADIDRELPSLAKFSLRNEVGAIGSRSAVHDSADAKEWIQVDFDDEVSFDEIVLVPTLWRDTDIGFQADGFPVEFRIIAGTSNDQSGSVIASYAETDHLLPRLAPVIVPCPGTTATWIRIEASRLSPRGFDGSSFWN